MNLMRPIFLLLFILFQLHLSAQFFKHNGINFSMYADTACTQKIGQSTYEHVWGKAIYDKDSVIRCIKAKKNQRGYFSVKQNGKWGGIDDKGNQVREFNFDGPFEQRKSGHYIVFTELKDSLNYLRYQLGSLITRYDSVMKIDTSYYVMDEYKDSYLVSANKIKFGIINADFKVLLPLKYESVRYKMALFKFNPTGFLPLENELDKCGVVNYQGKTVVPFNYEWMNEYVYNDNMIFVQNGKKKGFVNTSNQIVVAMRYELCPMTLGPKNLVADENYTWFVNEKFESISPKYQALEREGDVYFFKQNYKWGVMDLDMKVIVPNIYTSIEYGPRLKADPSFKCYYAVKNGKYGLISLTNEIIVPFEYECLCNLSYYAPDNYYIEFKKAGQLYRFDYTGKLVEKVAGEGRACLCEMVPGP